MSYLPLNSFTHPSALLSEEEYLSAEGNKYRELIIRRERYNFERFINLIETFKITESYSPIDIIEKFYSWGISGLHADIYTKQRVSSNKIYRKDGAEMSTSTVLTQSVFVDKYIEPLITLDKDWTTANSKSNVSKTLSQLTDANQVMLIPYSKPIALESIEYVFETFRVIVSPEVIRIITRHKKEEQAALRVYFPSGEYMPWRLWNFKDTNIANELLHCLKIQSLRNFLVKKLIVNCNVSSYKVYRNLGLSDFRAIYIIFFKYREIFLDRNGNIRKELLSEQENILTKDEIATLQVGILKLGKVFAESEDDNDQQDDIRSLIDKIRDGEINIDNVSDGIILDASVSNSTIYDHIYSAVKELNMSYSDIFSCINNVDAIHDKNMTLRLTDSKYYCDFQVMRRAAAKHGFDQDCKETTQFITEKAYYWLYITEIFSEPGAGQNRHVGVMAHCWVRGNNKNTRAVEEYIANNLLLNNDEKYLKIDTATIIFKTFVTQATEHTVRGKKIKIPQFLKDDINFYMKDIFEGTTELSNDTLYTLDYVRCFIYNATVSPYWVVPTGNRMIPVSSIFYKWNYGKNLSEKSGYSKLKGVFLPKEDSYSLNYIRKSYDSNIPSRLYSEPDFEPGDFEYYCMTYIDYTKGYKGRPPHPYDELYPNTTLKDQPEDITTTRHQKLYYISSDVSDENRNIKSIYDVDYTGDMYNILENNIEEDDNRDIQPFRGFIGNDLFSIEDFKTLKDIFSSEIGVINLYSFKNDTLIFENGTIIKYYEIETLDRTKYKVRQISGNLYLAYYKSGSIVRINL